MTTEEPAVTYYERKPPIVAAVQYTTGMTPLPPGIVIEDGQAVLPMGPGMSQPVQDTDWVVTDPYTGAQTVMIDDYFSRAFALYHGPVTEGRPVGAL